MPFLVSVRQIGRPSLLIEASACLGVLAIVLAAELAVAPVEGLWGAPAALALMLYAAIAALVLRGLPHHAPLLRFGAANAITTARAAGVVFIAALTMADGQTDVPLRFLAVVIGWIALLCDGIDGWAARRTNLASVFGARFDMEVDAFFVLVITFMLLKAGQAPAWVLAIGFARYIFVLSGWLWPSLARPLQPSMRRKTVCVATVVALLIALMPTVAPAMAEAVCAGSLTVLAYSFAVDCVWLLRNSRAPALAGTAAPKAMWG
jgi:phosphatidylglycerophosphate synthase